MRDDKSDASPLDGAAGTVSQAAQTAGQIQKTVNQARQGAGAAQKAAHTSQAAYVATASAQGGAAAAGATTGTALAGPLGTVVGVIVTSKTFWKVVGGILMAIFLWMFIIANLIGIILTYLGFADADAFANEAQSEELANLKVRVEQILDKEEYEHEIMAIIEQNRDVRLEEIAADKQEKYNDYELSVIDEYETKFKRNASYYLSIFLLDIWDSNTRNEFLGYSSEWGDMTTNLSSPYDAYFQEAAQSYGVPVALLKAMGKTESNFNQSAVSSAGAIGVMQLMQQEYELRYKDEPPYEVLSTKWLPYSDVIELKGIEEMVEIYYNSGQFTHVVEALVENYASAYQMYQDLWQYYEEHDYMGIQHRRSARYEIVLDFVKEKYPEQADVMRELLTYDYYLRENAKSRPEFAGEDATDKRFVRAFYEEEEKERKHLPGYEQFDRNQMRKMTHLEYFPHMGKMLLFDYKFRNPLNQEARTCMIKKDSLERRG